ncbi:hypothetical protein O7632_16270 [Solwaraspora sp. WMMD406]|uniref:hypothetical protein n=1 Tax=Solwaraspora sp. WMMD406 TaxID=3016095 RepID=UPI00241743CD|nr:hypothetical protein [Solwaraspora sp. WMMD406]MDG4765642.1 hypothetical protein [Solwaraspora sp. WMMD406]
MRQQPLISINGSNVGVFVQTTPADATAPQAPESPNADGTHVRRAGELVSVLIPAMAAIRSLVGLGR